MTLEELIEEIGRKIGPCPICGTDRTLIAVFENNDTDELIGFKIICGCNAKETMTKEEMTALHTYTWPEIINMIDNNNKA